MNTKVVTIRKAKTQLSRLIREACDGHEVVIAGGSKPVARIVAVGDVKGQRWPGSLKGKLVAGPEFFNPLIADELAEWE